MATFAHEYPMIRPGPDTLLLVRADAGPDVGSGHLSRCTAVARSLAARGFGPPLFLTRRGAEELDRVWPGRTRRLGGDMVRAVMAGYRPETTLVLLDSYETTLSDLEGLHAAGYALAMFDDGRRLARYPAGLVVDASPGASGLGYAGLPRTRFLLGSAYHCLPEGFAQARLERSERDARPAPVRHLVVTFGGSDPEDVTSLAVYALMDRGSPEGVTVVLGSGYRGRCLSLGADPGRFHFRRDPPDMAALLARADAALSGAGQTAMELAFLGVPALLLTLAPEQALLGAALEREGVAVHAGEAWRKGGRQALGDSLEAFLADAGRLADLSLRGPFLVDGRGADRVAQVLEAVFNENTAELAGKVGGRTCAG